MQQEQDTLVRPIADRPSTHTDEFWELAIATNAAIKGLLGSMGQSGHVCERTIPIAVALQPHLGERSLLHDIADAIENSRQLEAGDVIVLPDKLFSIAEARIAPREILTDPDPKTVDATKRAELALEWTRRLKFKVEPLHLLIADQYVTPDGQKMATLGSLDHNQSAHRASQAVAERTNRIVDVIISDTDTGLDVRYPLIGTITIGATPLGATAGLNLYEAMRCACAAEFERGHTRRVPIVLCRPAERRRQRAGIGRHRGYGGALHITRESGLTYA